VSIPLQENEEKFLSPAARRISKVKPAGPKPDAAPRRKQIPRSTAEAVKPKPLSRARRGRDSHLALSPKAAQLVLDVMRKFRRENPSRDDDAIIAAVIRELTGD
jgi:hypothetical protein